MNTLSDYIPARTNVELNLRYFPARLYHELKVIAEEKQISISALVISCCEFALEYGEGENL